MRASMNQQKALRNLLFFVLVLLACTPSFEEKEITGVTVDVVRPGTLQVDFDLVFEAAREQVQSMLPDAYLRAYLFLGQCESLATLEGKFNFDFIQVRPGFPRRRVVSALASVYTVEGVMDVSLLDVSDHYPSTVPLDLDDGLGVREVATIAHEEITYLGLQDCDVVLTPFDDYWLVVCTTPGSGSLGKRLCEFGIDVATGQIRNKVDVE